MFFLGKVLGLITQPLVWVAALLAIGLLVSWRKPRLGRGWIGGALGLLLLMGWLPLPDLGLRALEGRYAEIAPGADLSGYAGLVLLGGAMGSGYVAQAHSQPVLNDAAERMSATVAILLRHPMLAVVFTGGEGTLLGSGPSEANRAKVFFDSVGIAADRVRYESVSRNTYENAVLTAQMPGVNKSDKWLLLTSAWHMPRSMATFEKANWNVTAYPVDYRTGASTPWTEYDLQTGSEHWQILLRELVGMVAYRLTGRL
ncbi:MAG: YdcF family protein [Candidatus Saccharibacteria bacterium]|nr:YdcF family protein [Rhodoferax sp.]